MARKKTCIQCLFETECDDCDLKWIEDKTVPTGWRSVSVSKLSLKNDTKKRKYAQEEHSFDLKSFRREKVNNRRTEKHKWNEKEAEPKLIFDSLISDAAPSEAERARILLERQKQRDQEKMMRRREAQQGGIDMNYQADMFAAFDETVLRPGTERREAHQNPIDKLSEEILQIRGLLLMKQFEESRIRKRCP